VRVPFAKTANFREQRRHQLQVDSAKSATMRDAFPNVQVVHIELNFDDRSERIPSPQTHSLYPGARAFFRFACPCADCDGEFDLTGPVAAFIQRAPAGKRGSARTVSGHIPCQGTRLRDRAESSPCRMELQFRLVSSSEVAA